MWVLGCSFSLPLPLPHTTHSYHHFIHFNSMTNRIATSGRYGVHGVSDTTRYVRTSLRYSFIFLFLSKLMTLILIRFLLIYSVTLRHPYTLITSFTLLLVLHPPFISFLLYFLLVLTSFLYLSPLLPFLLTPFLLFSLPHIFLYLPLLSFSLSETLSISSICLY